jgi:ABC-2 type transport system permease protein
LTHQSARPSPASVVRPWYALEGIPAAVLDGAGIGDVWGQLWPLLLMGAASIPLGLAVFRAGERYAKRAGKLKRAG